MLVPKDLELTATPVRFDGDREKAKQHFEAGFRSALHELGFHISTLTFHSQSITLSNKPTMRTAREATTAKGAALLTSHDRLGDLAGGPHFERLYHHCDVAGACFAEVAYGCDGANTLASYIVLACRLRPADAPRVGRNAFVAELKRELPPALRHLQQGNVAPVDFAQAAIGPGMAVFSRYAAVLESSGKAMSVRTVLGLINGLKDELLGESVEELDKDTRWAVTWFDEMGFAPGEAGQANLLANAHATAVNGLQAAGIVEVKGNQVRLLRPEELPADWDPREDTRLTVWEMTHHLLRVYYHEKKGDEATAVLLRKLGSKADVARDLAYKLFTICENTKRRRAALQRSRPRLAGACSTRSNVANRGDCFPIAVSVVFDHGHHEPRPRRQGARAPQSRAQAVCGAGAEKQLRPKLVRGGEAVACRHTASAPSARSRSRSGMSPRFS